MERTRVEFWADAAKRRLFAGSPKAAEIYIASQLQAGSALPRDVHEYTSQGYKPPPPPRAEYTGDRPIKAIPDYATVQTKEGPRTGRVVQCQKHGINPVTGLCPEHSPTVTVTADLPENPARCDALSCCGQRVGRKSTGVYTQ